MNQKSMLLAVKVLENQLKMEFKRIAKYLDFFEKSIEAEKYRVKNAKLIWEDEMFKNLKLYDSHVSFPSIHNNALFIFMYSSFERMFCLSACWLSIGEDKGKKIDSLKDFSQSKKYIGYLLANGNIFESREWDHVESLRLVRNHLTHGGRENIIGLLENNRILQAAIRINKSEAGEAFDITKKSMRSTIEPNESAARIAMTYYRDLLFLLIRIARNGVPPPAIE